jgi:hypothetical protein
MVATAESETFSSSWEWNFLRFVEQCPRAEQLALGTAALLGMETSVHEVARVNGVQPHEVAKVFTRATTFGILSTEPGGRARFTHEEGWRAASTLLGPEESLAAHARAARCLAGRGAEGSLRRARHALVAAGRSTEDAVFAVQKAREAAALLQASDALEQAATLLGQAVDLHAAAALPGAVAALAVEHAEAVLSCGDLAEARPLFARAVHAAEAEADPLIFARAALGLGGIWVREHRFTEEAERVAAWQRRALEWLPEGATALRARLKLRLAVERVYRGAPESEVFDALECARRTGDDHVVAEALSLYHHVLLEPRYARLRLTVANDLIAVASVANNRLMSLMGLCWRTADLFLLGEPSATMALRELYVRADVLRCRGVLFIAQAMEVMLAIRAGKFEQAEQLAATCRELGTKAGDADALAYYGAHLAAIRMFQGQESELADLAATLAASPELTERDRAFATAAALFALRRGSPHEGRALLSGLKRNGIGSIYISSTWLITLQATIELAAELQDEVVAQAAYDTLLPHADLPIMASLAIVCFGSAHRPLGIAALACGKIDLAVEHFESALAANGQLGHRPAAIQASAELALALLRRGRMADRSRGNALIEAACAEAEALGMNGLITRWQASLAALRDTCVAADEALVKLASTAHGWRVTFGSQVATAPDLVGMRYIARLTSAPNQVIPAVALVIDQEASSLPANDKQEVMDAKAVSAIQARIRKLQAQPKLTSAEREELKVLVQELDSALGLRGRVRSFADTPERARTAVRKAIKRAIEQISIANPAVGKHLEARIETGAVCCYRRQ